MAILTSSILFLKRKRAGYKAAGATALAAYLGGRQDFGPLVPGSAHIVSRNLTPDKTARPAADAQPASQRLPIGQFRCSTKVSLWLNYSKHITIAAVCAFAIVALPARAQDNRADQAGRLSEQLILARSLQQRGQFNAARAILLEVLSKAPDSALLLNQLGSVQQDLAEYLEAERSYLHALSASAKTEGDPQRLVILNNLGTLYLETGQYRKSDPLREQLEKFAPITFENHPAAAARLLSVIGSLEQARNRDDKAETYYARSLQLFQHANGPVSVDAALVKNDLGGLRLEAGRYESAGEFFRDAIREIEIASGPGNSALIRPLVNLARCENMGGHANRAEPVARRAVELSVRMFGEGNRVSATAMLEQATALRRLRRKGAARDLEKRAKAWLRNNSTMNLAGYTISLRDLASVTAR